MNRPWLEHYGKVPHHLEYPAGSMSEAVLHTAKRMLYSGKTEKHWSSVLIPLWLWITKCWESQRITRMQNGC